MFEVLRGDPRDEVVIRLSGGLDESAGAKLASCIEQLPRAGRVVVDFSLVRPFRDVDVGAVARGLAGHADLAIRGLGRHQLRLLRYCGVQVPPAFAADEEREG